MRIALFALMLLAAPAFAADRPDADWHECATDTDCTLVPGICGDAAVNVGYKSESAAYYAEKKQTAKCPDLFWKAPAKGVRCHLERCEVQSTK